MNKAGSKRKRAQQQNQAEGKKKKSPTDTNNIRNNDRDDNKKDVTKESEKSSSKKSSSKIMTRQETCDLIAELSESVLEDPTRAFKGTDDEGVSKMRLLLTLAKPNTNIHDNPNKRINHDKKNNTDDEYIAQLSILSLLAIFRDILPSYRIRLPTEEELSQPVAKETKQLWEYERAMLTHYQQFLKLLEQTWEVGGRRPKKQKQNQNFKPSALAVSAFLSLCELLKTAYYFNFRSNILTLVTRQMTNSSSEVSAAACSAVEHVFENDAQGDIALEAARLVAKTIKDRNFKVRPNVIRTFSSLPLRVHVDEAQAAKLAAAASKKKDKQLKEIESELQEGSATVNKILLARCQSDTLQIVTVTYFRILKSDHASVKDMLPPALEGLAKFAHLINIDTVKDLLDVLKNLLGKIDALPLSAALNCVLTAFQTLHGPGKEMQIDQKEYITPLYMQLPRFCHDETESEENTEILLSCLTAAFLKRREHSMVRVAAFCKQIFTVAMHTSPVTSIPLMAFGRQLLHRYPAAHQLLENEQDAITSGQYTPNVEDPEHANPFATCSWELATLRFHIDSRVATQASGAASLKMLQLPTEEPSRLRLNIVSSMSELYIPFERKTKKHPLDNRGGNDSSGNKKRQKRARFLNRAGRTTTPFELSRDWMA